jgi:hypothetical protein
MCVSCLIRQIKNYNQSNENKDLEYFHHRDDYEPKPDNFFVFCFILSVKKRSNNDFIIDKNENLSIFKQFIENETNFKLLHNKLETDVSNYNNNLDLLLNCIKMTNTLLILFYNKPDIAIQFTDKIIDWFGHIYISDFIINDIKEIKINKIFLIMHTVLKKNITDDVKLYFKHYNSSVTE